MARLEAKFRKMGQSYECVIAAALEARRINAIRIHGGESSDNKVTTEAMKKLIDGDVEWEIGDAEGDAPAPAPADEAAVKEKSVEAPIED